MSSNGRTAKADAGSIPVMAGTKRGNKDSGKEMHMPVVRRFGFGKITSVTKADGTPYDKSEFRTAYVDVPGLVLFYESFNKFPGKYFLYLYPYCEGHTQTYFHSSCGDLAVDGHRYTLRTANSVYTAQDDPFACLLMQRWICCLTPGQYQCLRGWQRYQSSMRTKTEASTQCI